MVCLGYRLLWRWRCGLAKSDWKSDGLRVQLTFGKLGRNTQCACTAKAFCAVLARRLAMISWSLPNNRIWVCSLVIGSAVDGEVVLVVSLFQQAFFSLFDGFDNRRCAGCVFVHADAEIDFSGRVSALNASPKPKIGSAGAASDMLEEHDFLFTSGKTVEKKYKFM